MSMTDLQSGVGVLCVSRDNEICGDRGDCGHNDKFTKEQKEVTDSDSTNT